MLFIHKSVPVKASQFSADRFLQTKHLLSPSTNFEHLTIFIDVCFCVQQSDSTSESVFIYILEASRRFLHETMTRRVNFGSLDGGLKWYKMERWNLCEKEKKKIMSKYRVIFQTFILLFCMFFC